MRIFRRARDQDEESAATEFMWGVPRREGHSDTDDPTAHAGVTQHAFEFGRDDRAICGFEPQKRPSRAYRDPRPQLAVPRRDSPKCRRCELLVATRVRGDEGMPEMEPAANNGRPSAVAVAPAEEAAGEPEQPQSGADDPDLQPTVSTAGQPAMVDEEASSEPIVVRDADVTEAPEPASVDAFDQGQEGTRGEEHDASREGQEDVGSARAPGFQPRAEGERVRRRSVRKGGSIVVESGRRSAVIHVPVSADLTGIVANVEPQLDDLRVEAVTIGTDGTARVVLNKPARERAEIVWYIVSNPFVE